MSKKSREETRIKYAEGVEVARPGSDPDVASELDKTVKIRVTTMLDQDVLEALKDRAKDESDGRYQTYLNQILRDVLLGKSAISIANVRSELERLETEMDKERKERKKLRAELAEIRERMARGAKRRGRNAM